MAKCRYCGNELLEGSSFCLSCGRAVPKETMRKESPNWMKMLLAVEALAALLLLAAIIILSRQLHQGSTDPAEGAGAGSAAEASETDSGKQEDTDAEEILSSTDD